MKVTFQYFYGTGEGNVRAAFRDEETKLLVIWDQKQCKAQFGVLDRESRQIVQGALDAWPAR